MTNITIRPFNPADEEYKSVVALVNDEWPDNEENNPMHTLNLKLGFKPLPAYLTFEKTL